MTRQEGIGDLLFQIHWQSTSVRHTDTYAALSVNFWRDLLPGRIQAVLAEKQPGESFAVDFAPGELFPLDGRQPIRTLPLRQFDPQSIGLSDMHPRAGRFYPKGLLKDVAGIFSVNRQPFRCVEVDPERITVDLGHPLADKPIRVTATLIDTIEQKKEERGGLLRDWMEIMADGVGMQARWQDRPTDFFRDSPFARPDENVDARFYAQPRLVQHLDDVALEQVRQVYAQVIKEDMRVLDLMSSWHSHLPPGVRLRQVTGLGLNAHELQKNSALTDYQVHDLNNNPTLPFRDNHYDVIVCCVSVEYLTAPFDVFAEAARVLRPGGHLLTVFSNRWFPPKAVRIWTELHEFERMGLVLEYFHRSQAFSNLQTYSIRGLMRPQHDKYYAQMPFSDPVFAVWGQKVQR